VGLVDFGRPGDYFARQIARWSKQYRDTQTRTIEAIDYLIEWLPAHTPGSHERRIVHGDFRNDNIIFAPTEPEIRAVLDWELATVGHPLADVAQFAMTWRLPPASTGDLLDSTSARSAFPARARSSSDTLNA
jgi:aminoglycoside phosphotransferase (APT) family kinase protein